MHRFVIAILGVLDQKDHQKRDDGCAGVNHELPGIGIMKERTGRTPQYSNDEPSHEGTRRTYCFGNKMCETAEISHDRRIFSHEAWRVRAFSASVVRRLRIWTAEDGRKARPSQHASRGRP